MNTSYAHSPVTSSRFAAWRPIGLVAALSATLALGACSRDEQVAADPAGDRSVVQVDPGRDGQSDAARGLEQAKDSASATADRIGDTLADAGITTAVKAELAKDPDLSALAINVDTAAGRVLLKGKAPSQAASDRATQLAAKVDGVRAVDNNLVVASRM
jgi:hyperosmotically inducible periplasmic protein